jgi:hypothetical protein
MVGSLLCIEAPEALLGLASACLGLFCLETHAPWATTAAKTKPPMIANVTCKVLID